MVYRFNLISFSILILALLSCSQPSPESSVSAERFLANVTVLASDEFGGRSPMSEGERLTLEYLENQFRKAGLEPLFGESFLQAVPLISLEVDPESAYLSFTQGEQTEFLDYAEQFVAFTHRIAPRVEVSDSEIVFVGYGVVAPEYGWNDYADIDMSGKTALILVNDPGFELEDPELFKGRAMTYYGRWIYKLEEAARQGATAALIIHETAPASYGWDTVRK